MIAHMFQGSKRHNSSDNTLGVCVHIHRMVSQKANQRNAALVCQFDGQARWDGDGGNEGNTRQHRFLDDFERSAPTHQQLITCVRNSIVYETIPDTIVDGVVSDLYCPPKA